MRIYEKCQLFTFSNRSCSPEHFWIEVLFGVDILYIQFLVLFVYCMFLLKLLRFTDVCFSPPISTAPVFYFGDTEYYVDESDGYVEVRVWRTGTDLSQTGTVTVRSRKTDPVSAEGEVLHTTKMQQSPLSKKITSQRNWLCPACIWLFHLVFHSH